MHMHKLAQYPEERRFFFVFLCCLIASEMYVTVSKSYYIYAMSSAVYSYRDCASVFYMCFFGIFFFSRFLFVAAVNILCIQYKCSQRSTITTIEWKRKCDTEYGAFVLIILFGLHFLFQHTSEIFCCLNICWTIVQVVI